MFLLAMLTVPSRTLSQGIDISNGRGQRPHPLDLVLTISVDQMQNRAPAGLIVRITNDYSSVSRGATANEESQQTDKSGAVTFHTLTGSHEIRITGDGIEDYVRTIEITQQQSRDIENIVVKSKSTGGQFGSLPSGSSDVISASRLNVPDKALKEFKAGSKALEQKDYAEAKKRFTAATGIYGDYTVAFNGLGVAQMAAGDTPGARASFERAIKIDDHFAEAYRNLARLALADHNYEELDNLVTKSLQTEPLNAWALTYAAYAELQAQKFDLAITHARTAHTVPHPGLASVHIVAAHAFEATQQPAEALKEYKLYMQEDPNGRDAVRAKQAIASLSAGSK
jgi:Tfp pilus assembly protein PilF